MKTSKIKEKVAAKVAKGNAKVARKCGKGKAAKASALVLLCGVIAALTGCQGTTTPSRSQTLTFDDCKFYFYGGGDGPKTNEIARVEIGTQAMSIENSGSETQTATPTQTTDVKPDIDVTVPVNKANAGTSSAAGGALETVLSAGAERLGNAIKGSSAKSTQPQPKNAESCADGSCADGGCTDGSCSYGGECEDCAVK